MKRTIEIDDTLESRVQSAIEDVKAELENYLNNNPDTDSQIGWSFSLLDHLPDDFIGTRADAIKYLKDDIAENLGNYLTFDEIINNLKEVK